MADPRPSRKGATAVGRTWRLIAYLTQHGRLSVRWLSAHLGVSTRTVRRDCLELQRAGLPIHLSPFNGPHVADVWLDAPAPCPACQRDRGVAKDLPC